MAFKRNSREGGRQLVADLVERYQRHTSLSDTQLTETDVRLRFIDPLLSALGWDIRDEAGRGRRAEVVTERTGTDADGVRGRPDYRLRLDGEDVLPVEAKKLTVSVRESASSAIQARSYGWSLSLPAAVLTNFAELVIFDTTVEPSNDDDAYTAVRPGAVFSAMDYVSRFDELWDLASYESLSTRGLESVYQYIRPPRGDSPFDRRFLNDIRSWRRVLAQGIVDYEPQIAGRELGSRAQRLLNGLLFLRVCEDRHIGGYRELFEAAQHQRIPEFFKLADKVFNAGLFSVLRETRVDQEALRRVVEDMYWPMSQYAFGVMEPEILASVYEQYLAERILVGRDGMVRLEEKPEITHAGGVVTTPQFIVEEIVESAVQPALSRGVSEDFSVLDPAVGSGVFLLNSFQRLLEAEESQSGAPVTRERRAELATRHLFGIDIDNAAVEVTKFGLLLHILGHDELVMSTATKALPDLSRNVVFGNTVVKEDFDDLLPELAQDMENRIRANPLNLPAALGKNYPAEGFDVVLGNPPYVRIQAMSKLLTEQLAYLQHPGSGYSSPQANNFDLFMVFIERSLELLAPQGRLVFIVPHRFTNHLAAKPLRELISNRIERLIHFGEQQVFPGRSTYVGILSIGPKSMKPLRMELVPDLGEWKKDRSSALVLVPRNDLGASDWPVATVEQAAVVQQMRQVATAKLGDPGYAEIFVGVQTSKDAFFFIQPRPETLKEDVVVFTGYTGEEAFIERELLMPAIQDQQIGSYDGQPDPDRYAIFPYATSGTTPQPTLIQADVMRTNYPHAAEYFNNYRDLLVNRRKVSPDPGENFWAYGRSQSLTKMAEPKLVIRTLSLQPQYALDQNGLIVPGGGDGGPYYLLRPREGCPYSISVLQAILSHPAADIFIAVHGRKYRGSYIVHRKAFLQRVPLPELTVDDQQRIEASVTELRRLAVRLRRETDSEVRISGESRIAYLTTQVETLVTAAYGLDPELLGKATSPIVTAGLRCSIE